MLRTDTVYDLNSNVLRVCPPRQFDNSEPGFTATCDATALYGTHRTYYPSDRGHDDHL